MNHVAARDWMIAHPGKELVDDDGSRWAIIGNTITVTLVTTTAYIEGRRFDMSGRSFRIPEESSAAPDCPLVVSAIEPLPTKEPPVVQVELSWLEKLYDLLKRRDDYCDNQNHFEVADMIEAVLCEAKQCDIDDLYVTPREELRGKDSGW